MIAPEYVWAQNKQRECGGSIEEWAVKYNSMSKRLIEILEEKDLMKDIQTPYRTDVSKVRHPKTLQEAEFIKELPQDARGYGLESVMGFYEMSLEPKFTEFIIQCMGLTSKTYLELKNKIEARVGDEYVNISKERKKYF